MKSPSQLLEDASWLVVPAEAIRLAKLACDHVMPVSMRTRAEDNVWYDADRGHTRACPEGTPGPAADNPDRPWILVKRAEGAPFAPVAQLAGWKDGLWPGAPSAMTATLGSGLLGAGLGYGTGWLAEQMLPEQYVERGRLRRVGAGIGAAAGVIPPLWAAHTGWFKQAAEAVRDVLTDEELALHPWYERYMDMVKAAWDESGGFGGGVGGGGAAEVKSIPVDLFNQAIWADPYTPPAFQAAASGVVSGAQALTNGSAYVSPMDIARVGLGMGMGAASGIVAGKLLGALAGLKPEAQQTLQQVGTWGGLIQTAVPLLFGRR